MRNLFLIISLSLYSLIASSQSVNLKINYTLVDSVHGYSDSFMIDSVVNYDPSDISKLVVSSDIIQITSVYFMVQDSIIYNISCSDYERPFVVFDFLTHMPVFEDYSFSEILNFCIIQHNLL